MTALEIRKYMKGVFRARKKAISLGKSRKPSKRCYDIIKEMNTWLEMCPNANEKQMRAYLTKHSNEFEYLIPSKHIKTQNQLHELINPQPANS